MGTLISHNGCSCGVMKEKGIELLPITASFVLSPGLLVSIAVLLSRTSVPELSLTFLASHYRLRQMKNVKNTCVFCYLHCRMLSTFYNTCAPVWMVHIQFLHAIQFVTWSPVLQIPSFLGKNRSCSVTSKSSLICRGWGIVFFFICWQTKLSRCCQKSETSLSDTLPPLNNLWQKDKLIRNTKHFLEQEPWQMFGFWWLVF